MATSTTFIWYNWAAKKWHWELGSKNWTSITFGFWLIPHISWPHLNHLHLPGKANPLRDAECVHEHFNRIAFSGMVLYLICTRFFFFFFFPSLPLAGAFGNRITSSQNRRLQGNFSPLRAAACSRGLNGSHKTASQRRLPQACTRNWRNSTIEGKRHSHNMLDTKLMRNGNSTITTMKATEAQNSNVADGRLFFNIERFTCVNENENDLQREESPYEWVTSFFRTLYKFLGKLPKPLPDANMNSCRRATQGHAPGG